MKLPPSCKACGSYLPFWRRRDCFYCNAVCRQAAYRRRRCGANPLRQNLIRTPETHPDLATRAASAQHNTDADTS